MHVETHCTISKHSATSRLLLSVGSGQNKYKPDDDGVCYVSEWHFGWFLCKTVPYIQAVAVSASVNTLTAVAIER